MSAQSELGEILNRGTQIDADSIDAQDRAAVCLAACEGLNRELADQQLVGSAILAEGTLMQQHAVRGKKKIEEARIESPYMVVGQLGKFCVLNFREEHEEIGTVDVIMMGAQISRHTGGKTRSDFFVPLSGTSLMDIGSMISPEARTAIDQEAGHETASLHRLSDTMRDMKEEHYTLGYLNAVATPRRFASFVSVNRKSSIRDYRAFQYSHPFMFYALSPADSFARSDDGYATDAFSIAQRTETGILLLSIEDSTQFAVHGS